MKEIKHGEIIESILNKKVRDRKNWEHQFLIKYQHQDSVRRYLLSMGEFKDVEIKEDKTPIQYKCGHTGKPIILDDNILSMTAWMEWSESVGVFGDKTECWECWCRKDSGGEHE